MHADYHIQVTDQALKTYLSPRAVKAIIAANLGQDGLKGLFGHPEYHFDDSQFERGLAYGEAQRDIVTSTVKSIVLAGQRTGPQVRRHPCAQAWDAFGRLTHAVQDFYAHSNYVVLWVNKYGTEQVEVFHPGQIDPLDQSIMNSPDLRSGRAYIPLDILMFFPPLVPLVKPFIPRDSHTWMNLDHPGQGPLFPLALSAALKRTIVEYELTALEILKAAGLAGLNLFRDI